MNKHTGWNTIHLKSIFCKTKEETKSLAKKKFYFIIRIV